MKIGKMKPKWIKVGDTERDLFDVLDLVTKGFTIDEIVQSDNLISVGEIHRLLYRTKSYLRSHIILDCYLETVNQFPPLEIKLGWAAHEIRELVELHISGATEKNISILMRKEKSEIHEKLISLNLL